MDEVCEKRDAATEDEDRDLNARRYGEDGEADQDSANASPRADDRAINQAVGVTVIVVVTVGRDRGRPERQQNVAVQSGTLGVSVNAAAVSMDDGR